MILPCFAERGLAKLIGGMMRDQSLLEMPLDIEAKMFKDSRRMQAFVKIAGDNKEQICGCLA